MYCDKCGSRNDFDAVFCKKCGFNFNKNNKKLKNKEKITRILTIINQKKQIIITISIVALLIMFLIVNIYRSNSNYKYRTYLKKENFTCKKNICEKQEEGYNIKITLKYNRLIYQTSKVNENIIVTYAGTDLALVLIEDSLSKFNCLVINDKLEEKTCITDLEKAGKEHYLKKVNTILDEIKKILDDNNIKL